MPSGQTSLAASNIRNIGNSVMTFSCRVLYASKIDEPQSCRDCNINNVNHTRANQTDCSIGSLITSGDNGITMRLYIEGYNGEDFSIVRNSTDQCRIHCLSEYACSNLTVSCLNNNCEVQCGGSIECPNGYWSNLLPTEVVATPIPTAVPTAVPSNIQTVAPTN